MRKSIIIESITFIIQSSINVKGTIYKYPKMIKIRYKIFFKRLRVCYIIVMVIANRQSIFVFILTQIFKMMKLQFKNIPIYSKRMLAFYNQYWCKTQTLISNDIKTIILRQNLIFLNTPYPFCQVKDTYIDDDIIKNPQLSQIILIIT